MASNSTLCANNVSTHGLSIASGGSVSGVRNTDLTVVTSTDTKYLTHLTSDHTVVFTATQAGDIILPQATAANSGMVIKVVFAANCATSGPVKLGFLDSGSSVMTGSIKLGSNAGSETVDGFVMTTNTKALVCKSDDVTGAGGAIGSNYTFIYHGANTVFCIANGFCTTGTPALDAAASSATGV